MRSYLPRARASLSSDVSCTTFRAWLDFFNADCREGSEIAAAPGEPARAYTRIDAKCAETSRSLTARPRARTLSPQPALCVDASSRKAEQQETITSSRFMTSLPTSVWNRPEPLTLRWWAEASPHE